MADINVLGIDLAKKSFQLHGLDSKGHTISAIPGKHISATNLKGYKTGFRELLLCHPERSEGSR